MTVSILLSNVLDCYLLKKDMIVLSSFINDMVEGMCLSETESQSEKLIPIFQENGFLPDTLDESLEVEELPEQIALHAPKKILTFDCECIENPEDYAGLFIHFVTHADLNDKVSEIRSSYNYDNEQASLSCIIDGKKHSKTWKQSSDWVTEEYFEFVNQLFGKYFKINFVSLPAVDQCLELIILDTENSKIAQEFFDRIGGKIDPDEESGYRILLTIIFSIIGLIITTLVGWYFFGFWISFGISIGFWVIFALVKAIRIVNAQEAQEEFEKELQENPEMIGKLAVEFMEELKKQK